MAIDVTTQSIEGTATGGCGAQASASPTTETRPKWRRPPLSYEQILSWADSHNKRAGRWPTVYSGRVYNTKENWRGVDVALRRGSRGLPGGCTLARFLLEKRGVPDRDIRNQVGIWKILRWADEHHARHGKWPSRESGMIPDSGGVTWSRVDSELRRGMRRVPQGTTLSEFLAKKRADKLAARPRKRSKDQGLSRDSQSTGSGATVVRDGEASSSPSTGSRRKRVLRPLTYEQILAWADAHHARTGRWPTVRSGRIGGAKRENWNAIQSAMHAGTRGLPGGYTLARLLREKRGVCKKKYRTQVTIRKLLEWADAHHARYGVWPNRCSGTIPDSGGATWLGVDNALRRGIHQLRDGTTLFQFLVKRRGIHRPGKLRSLTVRQVLRWADQYFVTHGGWPDMRSGIIPNSHGVTWRRVELNLRLGRRGLPEGTSIAHLLEGRTAVGSDGNRS